MKLIYCIQIDKTLNFNKYFKFIQNVVQYFILNYLIYIHLLFHILQDVLRESFQTCIKLMVQINKNIQLINIQSTAETFTSMGQNQYGLHQPNQQSNTNLQNPSNITQIDTNNVLIHKKNQKQTVVYLPGYLKINVKNFIDMNLINLTSEINTEISFNIYYGNLFQTEEKFKQQSTRQKKTTGQNKQAPQTYQQELLQMLQSQLKLNFSRGQALLLSENINGDHNLQISVDNQTNNNEICFIIRKSFYTHIDGHLNWSPFELVDSILEVTVQGITFTIEKTKYVIRINLMDIESKQKLKDKSQKLINFNQTNINKSNLQFETDQMTFGKYAIAPKKAKAAYTNVRIGKSKQLYMSEVDRCIYLQKKHQDTSSSVDKFDPKYFQYATFNIPMFKFPFDSLVTVFVPLWLLGIINLGILFQNEQLSDRIGSIIALTIAYIAYLPTIQDTIPASSHIVFPESMVFVQILAAFSTFVHSMRIRYETNFDLQWRKAPQFWIALILPILSCIIVIVLSGLYLFRWKPSYTEKKVVKKIKKLLAGQYSIRNNQNWKRKGYQQINISPMIQNKEIDNKSWSNKACNHYFTRFFTQINRKQSADSKIQNNQTKQRICIFIKLRQEFKKSYYWFKKQQMDIYKQQIQKIKIKNKDKKQVQTHSREKIQNKKRQPNNNKINNPLIQVKYKKDKKQIQKMNVYLPGYLRFKFKNFIDFQLNDLGGSLNGSLIYSIYYGGIFDYLSQKYEVDQEQIKRLLLIFQHDFILLFAKDEAVQLTEGKSQTYLKLKQKNIALKYLDKAKNKVNDKIHQYKDNHDKKKQQKQQKVKIKRNIDTTIKVDKQKRTIQFTLRKTFQIRISGDIFLTPFQRIRTSIDITVNSLKEKIRINGQQKPISIQFLINLMDHPINQQKISISQTKKFGQYGLILQKLNAFYYNDKVIAQQQFQIEQPKQRQRIRLRRKMQDHKRIFLQKHPLFFHEIYKKLFYSQINKETDIQLIDQQKKQIQKYKLINNNKQRKFDPKTKYQAYKYCSFRIPLYKFPITSISSIFMPLWLLAVLNLGIFFFGSNLANRIVAIASLMIAFVGLIPIIRKRIPATPQITFIQIIIGSLLFTNFLALGHSISVKNNTNYEFKYWWNDAWFIISLLISINSCGVIVALLVAHFWK